MVDDSSQTIPVEPGTLVAGKYRVGAVIAAGGMGVVAHATHEELGQRVAIKFLHPRLASNPELIERFLREARAAAKVQSDHVVRVFDVGMHAGHTPYMAMEHLEGNDLADEIGRRGALPVADAVGYVLQALDAIAEAHALGIVHRDLKPSNLFLVKREGRAGVRVKVLDFGISKLSTEIVDGALTDTSAMLGSPSYMSPEQVRSTRSVDARTDVWSIGVILYELLSGEQAFHGTSLGEIFSKIREDPLPPIRSLRPDVPAVLEAVLSRCLARDRDARFSDAGELRDALAGTMGLASAHAPGLAPVVVRRSGFDDPTLDASSLADQADPGRVSARTAEKGAISLPDTQGSWATARPAKRRGAWLFGALGVLSILGVGVVLLATRQAETPKSEPLPSGQAAPLLPPQASAEPSPSSAAPAPSATVAPAVSAGPPAETAIQQGVRPRPATAPPRTPAASAAPMPRAPRPTQPKDDLGI